MAFDTAVSGGSVSLWAGERRIGELTIDGTKTSSDHVLPGIRELLELNEIAVSGVDTVVCTNGPGGYTGTRVGLSIARGLARALDSKLFGYTVYDVLLSAASENEMAVAVIDAGREEFLVTERRERLKHSIVCAQGLLEIFREYKMGKAVLATAKGLAVFHDSNLPGHSLIDASDNVSELLYRYHLSCGGKGSSLDAVYGRELVQGPSDG